MENQTFTFILIKLKQKPFTHFTELEPLLYMEELEKQTIENLFEIETRGNDSYFYKNHEWYKIKYIIDEQTGEVL